MQSEKKESSREKAIEINFIRFASSLCWFHTCCEYIATAQYEIEYFPLSFFSSNSYYHIITAHVRKKW